MKKIVSWVLSLALILSLVGVPVAYADGTASFSTKVNKAEVSNDGAATFEVQVCVDEAIADVSGMELHLKFDANRLEMAANAQKVTSLTMNATLPAQANKNGTSEGIIKMLFEDPEMVGVTIPAGVLYTITFKVKADATVGSCTPVLTVSDLNDFDANPIGRTVSSLGEVTIKAATPAHTHVWSTEWSHDNGYHWKECTDPNCDAKNNYNKHEGGTAYCNAKAQCTVCGTAYGDFDRNNHPTDKITTVNKVDPDHVNEKLGYTGDTKCSACGEIIKKGTTSSWGSHTYGDEWKYDATQHWKECTYEGCDKKGQEAAHEYKEIVKDEYKVPNSGSCTEPASYYKSCVCGAVSTETFTNGSAMGHKWTNVVSDATLKSPADCENAAVYYKTCSVCNKHDDESQTFVDGNALGHKWNNDTTKEGALVSKANCTSPAVYYKSCSVCGKLSSTETFESGKALGHTGGTATCEKKAECTRCNQTYGDFADHTYGDLIPEVPATHKTTGMQAHYQCSVCEKLFTESKTETTKDALVIGKIPHDSNLTWKNDADNHWHECSCGEVLDKAAHDFKWVVDKAATEEETGLKHEECAVCGAKRSEGTVIPQLDHTHNMELIAAKDATCTAEGNNAYYHCTKCDLYFKDEAGTKPTNVADEIIAKLAHTAVHYDRVEPTHFAAGNIEYWTCSVCGKYFSDAACTTETTKEATVLAKIEHTYSDKWSTSTEKHWHECSCGDKIDEAAHTWGEWTVTKAATATEAGEKQRECTVCHFTETAEILPLNCHTITFDANGGKTDATTAMTGADGKLTSLPAASRVGYSFKGWFTEKTGGEKVTTDTVFDDDATIYAQWVKRGGGNKPSDNQTDNKDNTKTDGKKVESGKTFDAGIAMYVGLSVLSVTGGALVIGKKKERF